MKEKSGNTDLTVLFRSIFRSTEKKSGTAGRIVPLIAVKSRFKNFANRWKENRVAFLPAVLFLMSCEKTRKII